jgi:putative NADH-flavin reductase
VLGSLNQLIDRHITLGRDIMNIAIFGANGPTGRLLTEQALAAGHTVTAFTRHADAFPIHDEHLRVVQGDALDLAAVESAVAGQDAVLSTLGTRYSRKPITLYSVAIANIVKAMHDHGVRRLVCVSSSVTDPATRSRSTGGGVVFEKVLKPFITNVVGKTMYADLLRMETLVMDSDLDWTIVRPSGLFETPTVTEYRVAETFLSERFTSRTDLAACLLEQASSDHYVRKTLAVATVAVKPQMVKLLLKEALGISIGGPKVQPAR